MSRKRYQHTGLTFLAWDTVGRELAERLDRLQALDTPQQRGIDRPALLLQIAQTRQLLGALRDHWALVELQAVAS